MPSAKSGIESRFSADQQTDVNRELRTTARHKLPEGEITWSSLPSDPERKKPTKRYWDLDRA